MEGLGIREGGKIWASVAPPGCRLEGIGAGGGETEGCSLVGGEWGRWGGLFWAGFEARGDIVGGELGLTKVD